MRKKLSKQKLKPEDNLCVNQKNKVYLICEDGSFSLSPKIHNAIYKSLNLNLEYEALGFQNAEELLSFFKNYEIKNLLCNVTYPYKAICRKHFIDEGFDDTEVCKFSGGCNLICGPNKTLHNLDGLGFVEFLHLENIDVAGKNILICGTGITAKSIHCALKDLSPKSISYASRKQANATYSMQNERIEDFDIIIDATSSSVVDLLDMPKIKKDSTFIDISYSAEGTPGIRRACELGLKAYDGQAMLICQAVLGIEKICEALDIKANFEFEKLYNIGAKAINC